MPNITLRETVLLAGLSLLLTACGGGGGGGNGGGTADTTAPTAIVTTNAPAAPDSALIPANTVVTITFSESMDTTAGTWSLGGGLASESDSGIWSMSSVQNDTLTISPASEWFAKPNRSLTIDARDLAGNAVATINLSYDVYHGTLYYVDTSRLDDTGNGLSPQTAKKYIHTAVANAIAPATVLVNAGNYRLSHALGTHVVLREKVSLYGGYSADFTQRDPATNITTIEDRSTTQTGSSILPHAVLYGKYGLIPITRATVIDGFTIQGSTQAGADYTAAITLYGISPTVQNNTINGGSGSGGSLGILNYNGASPVVQNNTINGGNAGSDSTAIVNYLACSPDIQNNILYGGNSINTTAIRNTSSSPMVQNNTINGGKSSNVSVAIVNFQASSPVIQNNILNGGSGINATAISNISSSPMVLNNMIDAGSGSTSATGVNNQSSSSILRNNTITGGSSILSATSITTTTGVSNTSSSPTLQNNTIYGGSGGFNSYGVYNADSSSILQNNTISGGSGDHTSNGVYIFSSSSLRLNLYIANNQIYTRTGIGSYCLTEDRPAVAYGTTPTTLRNNNLFGCVHLYYDYEGACIGNGNTDPRDCTLSEMNALTDIPDYGGNISTDPLFADIDGADNNIDTMADNDWHFSATTPASVTTGGENGIDQGWSFTDDKDGVIRPASGNPWSIGAYEP